MSTPCVALVGNLSEGYTAYGPYADFEEAADAHPGPDVWIVSVYAPPERGMSEAEFRRAAQEARREYE